MLRGVEEINWQGKIALLRADFNVPMQQGQVADDSRLRASVPTIHHVLQNGGSVVCLSHLGRPRAGVYDATLSLSPVAIRLSEILNLPVLFKQEMPSTKPSSGEVWVLENTRFHVGEKENEHLLASNYATLGDVFVLDAFATAHRAESSTCALADAADDACAGLLLQKELAALNCAMIDPARPLAAIVGGAKISTKFDVLSRMLSLADYLIVGGGIANTFLAAQGFSIGGSLAELPMLAKAKQFLDECGDKIILPLDVVVAEEISETAKTRTLSLAELNDINNNERILDVGKKTQERYATLLGECQTIIWNGPAGMFEYAPFAEGTRALAAAIADSAAYSLAGGGDTLAAVNKFNVAEKISYLSTGGGAFLELLSGGEMPALQALQANISGRI